MNIKDFEITFKESSLKLKNAAINAGKTFAADIAALNAKLNGKIVFQLSDEQKKHLQELKESIKKIPKVSFVQFAPMPDINIKPGKGINIKVQNPVITGGEHVGDEIVWTIASPSMIQTKRKRRANFRSHLRRRLKLIQRGRR